MQHAAVDAHRLVRQGAMHRATIVPQYEVALLPTVSIDKLRLLYVLDAMVALHIAVEEAALSEVEDLPV